ncbi:unnamed protein product [Pleuronectes platessa]|uniref:Uncharacterized protein n=1 Tax=Pleuronectes platessa TaxID=8262 RepID=A0A9N7U6P2_PLEPL|nr:unnamed protein product [Pleuronectes platessa]
MAPSSRSTRESRCEFISLASDMRGHHSDDLQRCKDGIPTFPTAGKDSEPREQRMTKKRLGALCPRCVMCDITTRSLDSLPCQVSVFTKVSRLLPCRVVPRADKNLLPPQSHLTPEGKPT